MKELAHYSPVLKKSVTVWKVSVFGVILVCILLHSDWVSPYSVQMRENAEQNNSEYWHFLRSAFYMTSCRLCSMSTLWIYYDCIVHKCSTFFCDMNEFICYCENVSLKYRLNEKMLCNNVPFLKVSGPLPAGIYLFKVNNVNNITMRIYQLCISVWKFSCEYCKIFKNTFF